VTQGGTIKVASLPARGVLVLESIPCASAAGRDDRQKALPLGPAVATKAVTGRSRFQARLELPKLPAPAGQPILGRLVLTGPRPCEPGWRVQLKAPEGHAIEPAESIAIQPGTDGKQKIDLLIYPPAGATKDQPIQVELTRRLPGGALRVAAPPNQK
jgi:hypothetical protein